MRTRVCKQYSFIFSFFPSSLVPLFLPLLSLHPAAPLPLASLSRHSLCRLYSSPGLGGKHPTATQDLGRADGSTGLGAKQGLGVVSPAPVLGALGSSLSLLPMGETAYSFPLSMFGLGTKGWQSPPQDLSSVTSSVTSVTPTHAPPPSAVPQTIQQHNHHRAFEHDIPCALCVLFHVQVSQALISILKHPPPGKASPPFLF